MKWALYNLAFAIAFPFMLPGFLARMFRRGGYAARMGDRFALYPAEVRARLNGGGWIWIHAVSVGEVQVALQLVRTWREVEPEVKFCFSTTSSTGWKTAEAALGKEDVLIYNPLDFPNFVKSALLTVKPRAIILTESEIWPIFIRRAQKLGIPLYLINARVSDRSAPRYAKAKWFFKDVFGAFTKIFAQSDLDKDRLVAAGAPEECIETTGSFKFDVARRNIAKESELKEWISVSEKILLGGSTWPGEDVVLLDIAKKLSNVTLVIAPRHFEKADKVEENIRAAGFECIRRSRNDCRIEGSDKKAVYLADTTGELMGLYGIADAVFVGKSLCEHGSQNMIEPCLCGKPTVVGPFTENFRPVMSDLLAANAIVQVKDKEELESTILDWFANGDDGLGKRAEEAVARRKGVVPKCVDSMRSTINSAPAMKRGGGKIKAIANIALGVTLAALAIFLMFNNGKKHIPLTAEEYRYEPVRIVSAYIALMEAPTALSYAIVDEKATDLATYFDNASLTAITNKDSTADIAIYAADSYRKDLKNIYSRVSEDGLAAILVDMRKMTVGEFGKLLKAIPGGEIHLWMPSENDWVLTAKMKKSVRALDAMLDVLTRDDAFDDLAKANCDSLPDIFASYVGTREEIAGAIAGDLTTKARCEFFVTEDEPLIDWIEQGRAETDIWEATGRQIHDVQTVRRNIIKGNILSLQKDRIEDAYEIWAKANRQNPNDTMLLSRLHLLAVNANAAEKIGNFPLAAKCYETMIAIRPKDVPAMIRYAKVAKTLGRQKLAEHVLKRAQELEEAQKK